MLPAVPDGARGQEAAAAVARVEAQDAVALVHDDVGVVVAVDVTGGGDRAEAAEAGPCSGAGGEAGAGTTRDPGTATACPWPARDRSGRPCRRRSSPRRPAPGRCSASRGRPRGRRRSRRSCGCRDRAPGCRWHLTATRSCCPSPLTSPAPAMIRKRGPAGAPLPMRAMVPERIAGSRLYRRWPGALGPVDVTVAEDRVVGLPAVQHRLARVDAVDGELPREQPLVGADHGRRRRRRAEVADRRHGERLGVVTDGVGADHRTVHAAGAALPDPAEAVHQEVVADVVPAQARHVVGEDAAQDARHLAGGVVVGADRVVDEAALDGAVAGSRADEALVRPPLPCGTG